MNKLLEKLLWSFVRFIGGYHLTWSNFNKTKHDYGFYSDTGKYEYQIINHSSKKNIFVFKVIPRIINSSDTAIVSFHGQGCQFFSAIHTRRVLEIAEVSSLPVYCIDPRHFIRKTNIDGSPKLEVEIDPEVEKQSINNNFSVFFNDMQDDLCYLSKKHGIKKFIIVGHSLGGLKAGIFAKKLLSQQLDFEVVGLFCSMSLNNFFEAVWNNITTMPPLKYLLQLMPRLTVFVHDICLRYFKHIGYHITFPKFDEFRDIPVLITGYPHYDPDPVIPDNLSVVNNPDIPDQCKHYLYAVNRRKMNHFGSSKHSALPSQIRSISPGYDNTTELKLFENFSNMIIK